MRIHETPFLEQEMAKTKAKPASSTPRPSSPDVPPLIEILRRFGSRVSYIRIRHSRLKKKIRTAEKSNKPTAELESEREVLLCELEQYQELLNDCVEWIHVRTGLNRNILLEVAQAPAYPKYKRTSPIFAGLNKLDERGENAKLWKKLLLSDREAAVSVGLLSSSESSPSTPETPISGKPPLSPPKEKWPREEYARNAIIRLKEEPELQSNISEFCRGIAKEKGIPEIAVSLKKLLYQPAYQRLWKHPE